MASPQVRTTLNEITTSSASQSDKIPPLQTLLSEILSSSSPEQLTPNLKAFIDTVLNEPITLITSRPVMTELVSSLSKLPNESESKKDTLNYLVEALRPRVVSYEESDTLCREQLADIHESENDNTAAANVLMAIQLESSQRLIPDEYRLKTYIRIMRNLLEDNESVTAERYLNRAVSLIHKSTDEIQNLHFLMCQARIYDNKRDFLNACQKYLQLSFSQVVEETERLGCLNAAIICAVLAPAGPARSRALGTLYKDDRAPQVEHYAILEKMYFDRLLSSEDVDAFEKSLAPHQTAQNADGTTVLTRAIVQHNLLAASRLYNNIGVEELGVLLRLPAEQAERYAARMIEQKRLAGQIDQIDKVIYFDGPAGTGAHTDGVIIGRQTRKWDANILALAEEVERVTSLLQTEHPEWVAANMVH
ncbi:hypothetical protein TWF788_001130 [Orbilia oligospora]|uniref:COP9 signalosome complex subunit 4 n=1 Tax=Orbilia oligospora TaxID=2813651 RepID=A0A6G1MCK7_ORBOL|nr:hypothetical protein TWF788_001130 [Orbilia oligospora]KAF3207513.1 hypothetical protein TWF679_008347 [Orbilia oligospora]KAF3228984.1 hypothetical protein TWF191_002094 [Orbilia oligospora]KAF3252674.1 hypothetical protein TWF192_004475 [Orbilia oligospora]